MHNIFESIEDLEQAKLTIARAKFAKAAREEKLRARKHTADVGKMVDIRIGRAPRKKTLRNWLAQRLHKLAAWVGEK